MPRAVLLSLVACVLAVAGLAQDDDPPFSLPKPAPNAPAPDDTARQALARQLCTAIDAGDAAAVTAALAAGANPNLGMGAGQDSTAGRTPLIHAVVANQPALVDLLVARGARLENGDAAGHTPLMYAALTGNQDLCQHLLRMGARPDTKDKQETTAADYTKGKAEIDALLARATRGHAAVLAALAQGDVAAARQAVAAGASPNAHDGKTSLLVHAVRKDDAALVGELLAAGCRPDLLLVDGFAWCTPLAAAAEKAGLPVLHKLLAARPDRAAVDDALSDAAASEQPDRKERVRLLLAAGANPNHASFLKPQALAMAAMRDDLETMALLLQHGADQASVDLALLRAADLKDPRRALAQVRALLAIGADPNHDHLFSNALGAAATHCHNQVMALLLADATKDTVNTAVGEAARAGNADGLHWLLVKGKSKLDLTFAAGVYHPPLIEAIAKGHAACVERLLEAGADVNLEPGLSWDAPLTTAVKAGKRELVERLLKAGADPRQAWRSGLGERMSALDAARAAKAEDLIPLLERAAQERDPLASLLDRAGLKSTDIGAFHQLRYDDADRKRGQVVYLRKQSESYGVLAVHEAFSLCYDAKEPPAEALLRRVFLHRYGIGGLVLEAPGPTQPNWRIRFRIDVPADVTPERLARYLLLVQATADALEQEITPDAEDRL